MANSSWGWRLNELRLEADTLPVACRLIAFEDLSWSGRCDWPCLDQVMLRRI
jgi:hypothetical protein